MTLLCPTCGTPRVFNACLGRCLTDARVRICLTPAGAGVAAQLDRRRGR